MKSYDLSKYPVHLGLSATATVEPEFTGALQWYADYVERHAADGAEARLFSMHTFTQPWDVWEMHPNGAEVVLCVAGAMTLHQIMPDGVVRAIELREGQYVINDPRVWHTADVAESATAVFITAGLGTDHRPRQNGES